MLAAEAAFAAICSDAPEPVLRGYEAAFRGSWVYTELRRARNFRPSFKYGLVAGTLLAGFDQVLLRGRAPWPLHHQTGRAHV